MVPATVVFWMAPPLWVTKPLKVRVPVLVWVIVPLGMVKEFVMVMAPVVKFSAWLALLVLIAKPKAPAVKDPVVTFTWLTKPVVAVVPT